MKETVAPAEVPGHSARAASRAPRNSFLEETVRPRWQECPGHRREPPAQRERDARAEGSFRNPSEKGHCLRPGKTQANLHPAPSPPLRQRVNPSNLRPTPLPRSLRVLIKDLRSYRTWIVPVDYTPLHFFKRKVPESHPPRSKFSTSGVHLRNLYG